MKRLYLIFSSVIALTGASIATDINDIDHGIEHFNLRPPHEPAREIGRQIIRGVINRNDPRKLDGVKVLFESNEPSDNIFAGEILLKNLLISQEQETRQRTAEILFNSSRHSQDYKIIGAIELLQDQYALHPQRFEATSYLFQFNGLPPHQYQFRDLGQKNREMTLNALRQIINVRPPHPDAFQATSLLERNPDEPQEPIRALYRVLLDTNPLPLIKNHFIAAKKMLEINEGNDRINALSVFRLFAESPESRFKNRAAQELCEGGRAEDRLLALQVFNGLLQQAIRDNQQTIGANEEIIDFTPAVFTPVVTFFNPPPINNNDPVHALLLSNNNAYKLTVLQYYQHFERNMNFETRQALLIELLRYGEPTGRLIAQHYLAPNTLFIHGNDQDKALARQSLRNDVETDGRHTEIGPRAALILLRYGNANDRAYVQEQARMENPWAMRAIRNERDPNVRVF